MAFRKSNGDYLGDASNYEYTGKEFKQPRKTSIVFTMVILVLLIIGLWLLGFFFLYAAIYGKSSYMDKNSFYICAGICTILGLYLMRSILKKKKEEIAFKEELERFKAQQQKEDKTLTKN